MSDIDIWWQAYLACLVGGNTPEVAVMRADQALSDYRGAMREIGGGEHYENG